MVRLKFVRKSVRMILLDETEDGPSEVCPKVRPKDLIGRDVRWSVWGSSECPSEWSYWTRWKMVRLKSVRRNMIGRKRNLVHMTMRPTCMSFQSDLIGRGGIWYYLLETLLIGWFGGSVFWKRFWLADPMDLYSSVFFWLLFTSRFAISYSHSRLTRNDTRNASSFCDKYAVQSAVDERNRQNERHLCYLLYPWWSFKTVHYANDVAR